MYVYNLEDSKEQYLILMGLNVFSYIYIWLILFLQNGDGRACQNLVDHMLRASYLFSRTSKGTNLPLIGLHNFSLTNHHFSPLNITNQRKEHISTSQSRQKGGPLCAIPEMQTASPCFSQRYVTQ